MLAFFNTFRSDLGMPRICNQACLPRAVRSATNWACQKLARVADGGWGLATSIMARFTFAPAGSGCSTRSGRRSSPLPGINVGVQTPQRFFSNRPDQRKRNSCVTCRRSESPPAREPESSGQVHPQFVMIVRFGSPPQRAGRCGGGGARIQN